MSDNKLTPPSRAQILRRAQHLMRKAGFMVYRASPRSDPMLRLIEILKQGSVDLVIDVGANRGQYALELFSAGYDGRIISFEPLPEVHAELTRAARQFSGCWIVAPCMALSDASGEAVIHVASNRGASSSLLEMTDSHFQGAPDVKIHHDVLVKLKRLDEVLSDMGLAQQRHFLKIDTQGSEVAVLRGATQTLPHTYGVMAELSLTTLYENQPLFRDVDRLLVESGFCLVDIVPGLRNPKTHHLLQFDGVYLKTPVTNALV